MALFVVTGGATGIGLPTVEGLLKKNHQVAVVGRDDPAHRQVIDGLSGSFPNQVRYFACDLASQPSIQTLIGQLNQQYTQLDGLINNAGLFPAACTYSPEGVETTFAVNVMAPYLLSVGLAPLLAASQSGRIINVSSVGERYARPDWHDLQSVKAFDDANRVYNNSKFYLTLLTYAMAEQLRPMGITVNCLHPGSAATNLVHSTAGLSWPMRLVFRLVKPFRQSPEKAARTSLFLATDASVASVSGQYFTDCKVAESSPASHNRRAQEALLRYCEQLRR